MVTVGNIIKPTDINDDNNILSKVRYQIVATNWSNSTDASGYYTYTLTLNPTLTLNYSPNIWIAGSTDNTLATDTEKAQYDLLNEQCNLTSESTLVLYAKTKPTSNFYIFVESKVSDSGGGIKTAIYTVDLSTLQWYAESGGYYTLEVPVVASGQIIACAKSSGWTNILNQHPDLVMIERVMLGEVGNTIGLVSNTNTFAANSTVSWVVSYI